MPPGLILFQDSSIFCGRSVLWLTHTQRKRLSLLRKFTKAAAYLGVALEDCRISPASVYKVDGWTVRTKDGHPSAQFEHSILMTEEGPEILTMTQDGPKKGFKF